MIITFDADEKGVPSCIYSEMDDYTSLKFFFNVDCSPLLTRDEIDRYEKQIQAEYECNPSNRVCPFTEIHINTPHMTADNFDAWLDIFPSQLIDLKFEFVASTNNEFDALLDSYLEQGIATCYSDVYAIEFFTLIKEEIDKLAKALNCFSNNNNDAKLKWKTIIDCLYVIYNTFFQSLKSKYNVEDISQSAVGNTGYKKAIADCQRCIKKFQWQATEYCAENIHDLINGIKKLCIDELKACSYTEEEINSELNKIAKEDVDMEDADSNSPSNLLFSM